MAGPLPKAKIAVLVADDHAVVRAGVVSLLSSEPDFVVVGEAADGKEAVRLAQAVRPHVAVLDISMPRLNGLTAAGQIRRALPHVEIIMLSVHGDHAYVAKALSMGVRGYLLKQAVAAELAQAIRAVHRGRMFISPEFSDLVTGKCARRPKAGAEQARGIDDLTLREVEVLQLVAEGYGNKEIAQLLDVSVKTIETHRARLMSKLDIHETAGLVRYAIRKGIVQA